MVEEAAAAADENEVLNILQMLLIIYLNIPACRYELQHTELSKSAKWKRNGHSELGHI
jgi:hypothetical protein